MKSKDIITKQMNHGPTSLTPKEDCCLETGFFVLPMIPIALCSTVRFSLRLSGSGSFVSDIETIPVKCYSYRIETST